MVENKPVPVAFDVDVKGNGSPGKSKIQEKLEQRKEGLHGSDEKLDAEAVQAKLEQANKKREMMLQEKTNTLKEKQANIVEKKEKLNTELQKQASELKEKIETDLNKKSEKRQENLE